jgi:hypothetical protein
MEEAREKRGVRDKRDGAGFFGLWVCLVSFVHRTKKLNQPDETQTHR